jgi:uncharacterized membrane protein YesL
MFDKFFADNPFWHALGQVFDIFVLNVLWLLCCIPVFTIGPSTTAFYYCLISLVRGEESYVSKDFFRSFKRNFRQAVPLGLIFTAVGAFLVFDIYVCRTSTGRIYTFFLFFFAVIFLLWAAVTVYVFPLLSKFEKKSLDLVIWAFMLCIRNLWRTLLMLLAVLVSAWLIHLIPGLVFIIIGVAGQFQMALFEPVIKPWLPKAGEDESAGNEVTDDEA